MPDAMSPDSEVLLTQDEADALADGTEVIVTWSGGNGPHRYTIHVAADGRRFAGDLHNDNPLRFVGLERYHTHVALAAPTEEERQHETDR